MRAASKHKKLRIHAGTHYHSFYSAEGRLDQLRFFDHWLKGIDTAIMREPPVKLLIRKGGDGNSQWRFENEWPLKRTLWTQFFLRPPARGGDEGAPGALVTEAPRKASSISYSASGMTKAGVASASWTSTALAGSLPRLRAPLLVAGGGHDLITPGREAWRIFEDARCQREILYYPRAAHDCFNVLSDLRPRMVNWLAHQLEKHHVAGEARGHRTAGAYDTGWPAAEAVDADFADALCGDVQRLQWNHTDGGLPARFSWRWNPMDSDRIEVVHQAAPFAPRAAPPPPVATETAQAV